MNSSFALTHLGVAVIERARSSAPGTHYVHKRKTCACGKQITEKIQRLQGGKCNSCFKRDAGKA